MTEQIDPNTAPHIVPHIAPQIGDGIEYELSGSPNPAINGRHIGLVAWALERTGAWMVFPDDSSADRVVVWPDEVLRLLESSEGGC